jgi:hypothetical protein
MKWSDIPELLTQRATITVALAMGDLPEDIFAKLRAAGVCTTFTRVQEFCRSLGEPQLPVVVAPTPPPSCFPELEAVRNGILSFILGGFRPAEIWGMLPELCNVQTTQERVTGYIEQLLHELFPPGPINRGLFEVSPTDQKWDNSSMILSFGEGDDTDVWTVGDFSQGLGIFGGTGSGKTSGSGLTFAYELISRGYGGLVLTTKQGEATQWMNLVCACNRGQDLSIIRHDGPLHLNLLQYEMEHPGVGSEFTENIVDFFKNLLSVLGGQQGRGENPQFWKLTGEQLLRNLIGVFLLAKLPLTLDALCEFVASAPMDAESAKPENWPKLPVFGESLKCARDKASSVEDRRICKMLEEYWLNSFPRLAPETRSCITISFSAMLDALRARHIYDLLSTTTTITPEAIFNGRIIVIDLPINEFQNAGLLVQTAWKYLVQRAILRRPDKGRGAGCRPVFLWEDECQNFLIDFDAEFQSRARDGRVARVMLTQNLNCLYGRFGGGDAARVKVDAVLGNLNTKLFHANGDNATNKWASELIGTEYRTLHGRSVAEPYYHGLNPLMDMLYPLLKKPAITHTEGQVREPIFHPHDFINLMTGGPQHDWIVEGIATRVGRPFVSGLHYTKVCFRQPSQTPPPIPPNTNKNRKNKL